MGVKVRCPAPGCMRKQSRDCESGACPDHCRSETCCIHQTGMGDDDAPPAYSSSDGSSSNSSSSSSSRSRSGSASSLGSAELLGDVALLPIPPAGYSGSSGPAGYPPPGPGMGYPGPPPPGYSSAPPGWSGSPASGFPQGPPPPGPYAGQPMPYAPSGMPPGGPGPSHGTAQSPYGGQNSTSTPVQITTVNSQSSQKPDDINFASFLCIFSVVIFLFWWGIVIGAGMIQHGALVSEAWKNESAVRTAYNCQILGGVSLFDPTSSFRTTSKTTKLVVLARVTLPSRIGEEFMAVFPYCEMRPWPNGHLHDSPNRTSRDSFRGAAPAVTAADEICHLSPMYDPLDASCLMATISGLMKNEPGVPCFAEPEDVDRVDGRWIPYTEDSGQALAEGIFSGHTESYPDESSWPGRRRLFFLFAEPQHCGTDSSFGSKVYKADMISEPQDDADSYRSGGIAILVCFILLIVGVTSTLAFTSLGKGIRQWRKRNCS